MHIRSPFALAAATLSFLVIYTFGCTSGVKVNSDFDPEASFGALRTWSWADDEPLLEGGVRVERNTLLQQRVSNAIERTLSSRGYRQVERNPDFRVAFSFGAEEKVDVRSTPTTGVYYGRGYRGRRGGVYRGWGGSTVDVDQYTEGTLILDVLRPDGEHLLWRGTGTARIREESDPQKRTERVNEAVEKILSQFPPTQG